MNLIKKLDNLKVLLPAAQEQRMIWSQLLRSIYKTAGLEELMRVNDSGKNIKILVKSGAQILRSKNFDVYWRW
jgi:hypothetical protein